MDPSEEIIDEYFEYLADRDVYRAPTVLSWLTDYIDTKNENAIYKLLQHNLASEAVAGLVDLLEFDDKRLTESVVHILGTIVEHPRCRQYVLEVPRNTATTGQNNPTLFTALVNMLMSEDKNVVMNAAGTIANIAESSDGRLWILQQAVFDDALPILGVLTVDPHQWAASNSALVLARLTLSQEGIVKILTHERSSYVLINLSSALCGHNPGSSMNAAFAVGRLLEREDARSKLLSMKNFKNTMTALTKMLYNKEAGPRKNACFAFSCLANSKEGHDRLLSNVNSELILDQLVRLITDTDDETAWFAAVTLRSVGSQKEGVFRLRDHKSVYTVLKKLVKGGGVKLKSDLLTEVKMTLDIIGKLPKLPAPVMTTIDSFSVSARWDSVIATTGNRVTYQLFQGCTCVYEGSKTSCTVKNLKPFTSYVFRIRAINNTDEGPYSGPALITTNEGVPGPPGEVNNEGKPQHNSIKISWTPPPNPNGTLTGYVIYSDGKRVGVVGVDKLSYTVKDLPHSTSIPIQVAPVTAAGEGEKSVPIMCSTLNLSDYPPKKPILSTSGGANEINVSWIDPPKQLGPIDHYELVMNGEVVYSGKEQGFRVSNLEPLTNYTFNVRVVTADGYVIESEPARKKAGSKEDEDSLSSEEKEALIAERDAMEARLKAELARLKALEKALKDEEMIRRQEVEHKLTLGSRGGPAYSLDDPDIASTLSGSLLDKLRAAGITDISMLEEKDILALGLTEDELNNLLDAIYMAKYLKASPQMVKFLHSICQDPLKLWKLNYQDVNNFGLTDQLKEELFGHVLNQQASFVANVEIPTSRKIILKGWKDENLAFTPRHDAKLVTENFQAKEELICYIDKLRAVVQKNGNVVSGTESDGDLPDVEQTRTPTPEIIKPVSDTREIIRPKKKSDRFTTNKKQTSDENSKTSPRKPAQKDNNRRSLTTIDEVSSSVTLDTSPPASAAPKGISEVVVTKSKVPPNTAESSLSSVQQSNSSIVPGDKPDPRSIAAKSMSALLPKSKSVTFSDDVQINTGETASLRNPGVSDSKSVYVPNVLTSRVKAFDPETAAEISDTAISLDNDNHKGSVDFLVDYVTSYEAKSEDGATVVTSPLKDECDVKAETNLSKYFASKTYNHALSSLEDSVKNGEETETTQPDITGTELFDSDGVTSESKSLDPESKSLDTTSYTSFSSGFNQKIGITSLSSIASLDTESLSTSSLNTAASKDNAQPTPTSKDIKSLPSNFHETQNHLTKSLGDLSSNINHSTLNSNGTPSNPPSKAQGSKIELDEHALQNLSNKTPQSTVTKLSHTDSSHPHQLSSQSNLPHDQISNGQVSANNTSLTGSSLEPSDPHQDHQSHNGTSQIQESNEQSTYNGPLQKAPSQFQISLDSIPQHQNSQSHRMSNQPTQPSQNQPVQNQPVQKVVVDGHIPQVEISLDNIPDAAKAHLALQRPGYQDTSTAGRKNQGRNVPKDRSRRRKHDSDELGPARSLNDILLLESDSRKLDGDEMIPEQNSFAQNEALNYKHDYKSNRRRFNMDHEERNIGEGVEEQNKLITALIAQQNSDFEVQNKRTQQLINTVRNNIKNAIQNQSKRELQGPNRQFSRNKFISAVNATKRSIKLSSVNMNMFGDMDSDFPQYQTRPTVNPTQSRTSPLQGRRKQKRKKQQKQLPPVHRQGPATADIQFHFPKL